MLFRSDDIVVCPECGTPYHRDCYKKEGRCINDELHSKHMSWKAEVEEKEQAEGLKCSVCGNTLRNDQLFCDKCDTPTPYYLSQKDKADGEEQESFSNGDTFFNNAEQNAMETMYPYMLNYSDPLNKLIVIILDIWKHCLKRHYSVCGKKVQNDKCNQQCR